MKKILFLLAVLIFLIAPLSVYASQTLDIDAKSGNATLTFTWTGAAAGGAVPNETTTTEITKAIKGMYITEVRTNPGATAPTTLYDIVLNDADGIDLMGGTLADRSATVSERAIPALSTGVYGATMITSTLTMVITNQAVNSATGTVKVYLSR